MKTIISVILITLYSLSGFAAGESTVGNGGSIVVDGSTFDLADLHFVPLPSDGFTFDDALKGELGAVEDLMRSMNYQLYHRGGGFEGGAEFWEDQVYSNLIEYKFVATLPSGCQEIPTENLPGNLHQIAIGCTQGSITYLIPSYFEKFSLLEKALLIVHERLHSFAPTQPYDLKTDIVRGLYILRSRYQPALQAGNESFKFSDDELSVVNRLSYRSRKISGDSYGGADSTTFTANGARLQNSSIHGGVLTSIKTLLVNTQINGSDIDIRGMRFDVDAQSRVNAYHNTCNTSPGGTLKISGDHLTVRDSSYCFASTMGGFSVSSVTVENSKLSFEGSNCSAPLTLRNVEMKDSSLEFSIYQKSGVPCGPLQLSDVKISKSDLMIQGGVNVSDMVVESSQAVLSNLAGKAFRVNEVKSDTALNVSGERISLAHLKVSLPDSYEAIPIQGHDVSMNEVSLNKSFFGGTLENVKLSQVAFESATQYKNSYFRVTILPNTILQNIAKFSSQKENVTFGTRQSSVVLDGHGESYSLGDGWFSPDSVSNQAGLDHLAN